MADEGGAGKALIEAAREELEVTDSLNRVFKLAKPPALAQLQLVKVLGGELAGNMTYVTMVMPLLFVRSIDGEPQVPLRSERMVEAAFEQVGDEGMQAIIPVISKKWGLPDPNDPEAVAAAAEAQADAIKK